MHAACRTSVSTQSLDSPGGIVRPPHRLDAPLLRRLHVCQRLRQLILLCLQLALQWW